jgi:two-component system alkaline phosphatase synthesis response regulator PhoP
VAKKILLVDDEPAILKVTGYRLQKLGFEVITAENGPAALEAVSQVKPDLILLDLLLPVMDGCEVCRAIKSSEEFYKTPVILFTAATEEIEKKVQEAGADDYVFKPFSPQVLIGKINKFLS